MSPLRLAVLCDYLEEKWPSMQLVADMLLAQFSPGNTHDIDATRFRPKFHRVLRSRNADRLLNRLVSYPLHVRRATEFDVFHVVDHSYSQLVHVLPAHRTVVTCHDVDTFRCLFDPKQDPRPRWFRAMAGHILRGLQKAAIVVCVSEATRAQLVQHQLVDPARTRVIHNGVHPAYTAAPFPDCRTELLHVGSTIPRKRIDVLLHVFANCRARNPHLHLVHVGAPFTADQARLASQLAVHQHITHFENITPEMLAVLYRRAALLLLPSEAEGFGLPLVESLSCGTPVAASDIPALREVGGLAVDFYPVGDITQWSEGVLHSLEIRSSNAISWYQRTALCLQQASLFSRDRNARELAALYRTLLTQNEIRRESWEK